MLKQKVFIGAVCGFFIGIVEALVFSTSSGINALFSDLLLACLVLGIVIGWLASCTLALKKYYLSCAGVGLLIFLGLAMNSGMYLDDTVQGLLSGLIIGAATLGASSFLLDREEQEGQ
jgi:hypothetical protein